MSANSESSSSSESECFAFFFAAGGFFAGAVFFGAGFAAAVLAAGVTAVVVVVGRFAVIVVSGRRDPAAAPIAGLASVPVPAAPVVVVLPPAAAPSRYPATAPAPLAGGGAAFGAAAPGTDLRSFLDGSSTMAHPSTCRLNTNDTSSPAARRMIGSGMFSGV